MNQQDKIREIVQAQIIDCLNRFYAMETGMWGGPLDALIVRTVVVGKMEGRLYDLSALSNTLGIPVSTVHRKVRELEGAGLLTSERDGRSIYLAPTEKTCVKLDKSFDEMISTLERLYRVKRILSGINREALP
jgi:DNA-binding MarR family transcriptional regulator